MLTYTQNARGGGEKEEERVRYKRRLTTPRQPPAKAQPREDMSESEESSSGDEEVKEKLMLSIADVKVSSRSYIVFGQKYEIQCFLCSHLFIVRVVCELDSKIISYCMMFIIYLPFDVEYIEPCGCIRDLCFCYMYMFFPET